MLYSNRYYSVPRSNIFINYFHSTEADMSKKPNYGSSPDPGPKEGEPFSPADAYVYFTNVSD